MKVNRIDELVGNTPLVELHRIKSNNDLKANLFAKVEYFNPSGSVKDRAAKQIFEAAQAEGLINKDTTIVEGTSGNFGIAIAMMAAVNGNKAILAMPSSMSKERIKLTQAYGAEIVLTDASKGMNGANSKAEEIAAEIENSFVPHQFDNSNNPASHYDHTAKEILNDLDGDIDYFVAGVGTGGTISGTGKYLKEIDKEIKIVAVEPVGSPFISKGVKGPHKIQGIGAGFIPTNLDEDIIDSVLTVADEDAFNTAAELGKVEGFLVGISSGAALSAAIELAKQDGMEGKNIVVLLPDTGERYLSTALFD
ncbi:MAG: cysteine synthase A [Sphaerochaetaceae bacterium]|jgi:cysteine synthase A|nr:cysteine synthase A [Sphaerochaetaceae bacterium]